MDKFSNDRLWWKNLWVMDLPAAESIELESDMIVESVGMCDVTNCVVKVVEWIVVVTSKGEDSVLMGWTEEVIS